MKKKKIKKTEKKVAKPPVEKKKIEPVVKYTIGKWKGLPHYQCLLCSFDTLSKADMQEHIARHTARHSGKVNRFGSPITEKEG